MRRLLQCVLIFLLAMALGLAALAQGTRTAKRLVLKDGTFQMATKWEVKGDRVRYYSAERFMWEELPNSLVDWNATNQWEKDHPAGAESSELRQLSAEEEAERKAEEAKTPAVAPGLKLPFDGGVYLLDRFQQEPALVEIVQNGGEINAERGKNILRAAINPFASMKQSIEVKGTRARVQAHQTQPVFFLNVATDDSASDSDPDPAPQPAKGKPKPDLDQMKDRFRIVRMTEKKGSRVVGNLKIALTGHVTQQGNWVAANEEPVSGGWVKVTPTVPLAPGEYAIVEMLSPKEMNLYVWDFGVDPSAPRNPEAWRPAPVQKNETGTNDSPVLQKHK
ncbi:MAG TPA: hypothetical protein VL382_08085 [Terriglobales bacterium]|nr:hypothetical protein [Terriglobales bacterium]